MKEQLITFETAKLAKEKGFDEICKGFYYAGHYETWKEGEETNNSSEIFDSNSCTAPTQGLLQKWLREIYDIHINIRHEDYFHLSKYKYFHYDISQGSLTDVTKNVDLHGDILDECSQDIPGNYLNDEKFSKLVFEREFAFKTYEEALEHGLQEAIKFIKDETN
jgi:hypothetical protein